jgi:hypothetical protein
MPLSSDRDTRGFYQIYLARRASQTAAFAAPVLLKELSAAEQSTVDGYLTEDGLAMYYVRGPAFGPADMFVAKRRTLSEPFGYDVALSELNTAHDERDPFLSTDDGWLYFSSNRSGQYEIYMSRTKPAAP